MKVGIFTFFFRILFPMVSMAANNEPEKPGFYVIFDVSNSMWGQLPDGSRKIEAARKAFSSLDSAKMDQYDLALRLYGHRSKSDCNDTELVVPFAAASSALPKMQALIGAAQPKGRTPIGKSLQAALADFNGRTGEILLISDGIESCGQDPCALARSWVDAGVQLRTHVVGLGVSGGTREALRCIADTTGGTYADSGSASDLASGIEQSAAEPKPKRVYPVRVFAQLKPKGGSKRLVVDFIAVQNGADIETLHYAGGGVIKPGTYTFEVRSDFTPFRMENVVIDTAETRTLNYEIPVGWVEMEFSFQRPPKTKTRIARIYKLGPDGKPGTSKIKIRGGEQIPLAPGRYRMVALVPKGSFEEVDFQIEFAKTTKVVLAQQ
jgi:hypothetical protein